PRPTSALRACSRSGSPRRISRGESADPRRAPPVPPAARQVELGGSWPRRSRPSARPPWPPGVEDARRPPPPRGDLARARALLLRGSRAPDARGDHAGAGLAQVVIDDRLYRA